jgi:hypothetical protein
MLRDIQRGVITVSPLRKRATAITVLPASRNSVDPAGRFPPPVFPDVAWFQAAAYFCPGDPLPGD